MNPAGKTTFNGAPLDRLLLTARETARMLGISERTLWGLNLPRVPIGRRQYRYATADVVAWVEASKCSPLRIRAEAV